MKGKVALVMGAGITGVSVARHLLDQGWRVVVADTRPDPPGADTLASLGVELVAEPDDSRLRSLVAEAGLVAPNPGIAPRHPIFALAAELGVRVAGEIELAFERTDVPIVAVTGTNGKTTVTTMVAAMLVASGLRAVAAGNIGLPLIDAVDAGGADVFVAEVSSYQLALTERFRPRVATWLNFSPDHLDHHDTLDDYARAKELIFARQEGDDLSIGNADDAVVAAALARSAARKQTFGLDRGDWRLDGDDDVLRGPAGEVVIAVADLPRPLPHEIANALAATATAVAAGAGLDECRRVLATFGGLPHRVELIGDSGGVRFYDDSKATTPASVVAAVSSFDSVVLIAGGRNKNHDLSGLGELAPRVRAVVAIGEAAPEISAAFEGRRPVTVAASMDDAVRQAVALAESGDAVLLSPGCASYDWYGSYGERGDDFARAVREIAGAA
ncbi:MAG: UDP-N-acetylmuramoylalanine--D-glutamate ligase [Actinomycetota bacterium]|jgi:UDP-N-acetylmuramoylalanine--D-glutamate ligase|nr:UDP-N-acetylmuramoylalanine--D-glutamate ligase [Actinomycetota bacterium]